MIRFSRSEIHLHDDVLHPRSVGEESQCGSSIGDVKVNGSRPTLELGSQETRPFRAPIMKLSHAA